MQVEKGKNLLLPNVGGGHGGRLSSIKKGDLKTEDPRLPRACIKVLGKLGEDLTPKLLDFKSQKLAGWTQSLFDGNLEAGMVFDSGRSQSIAGYALQSENRSVFGEVSSQIDVFDPTVDLLQIFQRTPTYSKKRVFEQIVPKDPAEILLTQTKMQWLMDISSHVESSECEDAPRIKNTNDYYLELVKNMPGNDRFVSKEMNTIVITNKTKGVQTLPFNTVSKGCNTSWSSIYDTMLPIWLTPGEGYREMSFMIGPLNMDDDQMSSSQQSIVTQSRDISMATESAQKSLDSATSSESAVESEEAAAPVTSRDAEKILASDAFKNSLFYMERAVNLNTFSKILATYHNLPQIQKESGVESKHVIAVRLLGKKSSFTPAVGLTLKPLWSYDCALTASNNISCLTWNHTNLDLLAVGHGQFEFHGQGKGLVCCWSCKNLAFPERIYHTDVGVMALAFSFQNPCLLAVGLYNGVINIYNVSTLSKEPILDTLYNTSVRHFGPVWDLAWISRDDHFEADDESSGRELLMSIASDGHIKQWGIRQGFTCKDLIKLKHVHGPATSKMKEDVEVVISKHDAGFCFDFCPFDIDTYVVGTEDGLIHRCSCVYTEQTQATYTGHTGPVYQIRWSPFNEDIFVSCSGDWSVRVWHQEHLNAIIVMSSNTKAVLDVDWSPFNQTVLAFNTEDTLEIWNLRENILDPVVVHTAAEEGAKYSAVKFALNSKCILVGDSDGSVTVFQLPVILVTQEDQTFALKSIMTRLINHLNSGDKSS